MLPAPYNRLWTIATAHPLCGYSGDFYMKAMDRLIHVRIGPGGKRTGVWVFQNHDWTVRMEYEGNTWVAAHFTGDWPQFERDLVAFALAM